jgi:Asp-tRNA(Asn)/Glu-tRNA(Gln) amidotransferase A subunit family amidase
MTTSPYFGPRTTRGRSTGSAAARAAGAARPRRPISPRARSERDTAGSIRIPSCFCGVTGLRPTTGFVRTDGVVPVAWSLDTVGPIARSAEDCAPLLAAPTDEPFGLVEGVPRPRIGVVDELFAARPGRGRAGTPPSDGPRGLGATVESVEVPLLRSRGRSRSCSCPGSRRGAPPVAPLPARRLRRQTSGRGCSPASRRRPRRT